MIQLSDHFDYRRLLRYTFPTIAMMIFTSIYSVVDGFFVSNYTGKTPFAAVNLIMPFMMILGCVGFMFGTGGGALIAQAMGEGKPQKANELFSMLICISALLGIVIAAFSFLVLRPVCILLGADGELLENCILYGTVLLIALPFFILQFEFQCLFPTAEKPKLGLFITMASGVANMVLDALFVAIFHWGLLGAAAATAVSQFVGGVLPLLYFAGKNNSRLRFTRFKFDKNALWKACFNGSSELMNNISMSLVGILYNLLLIRYAGENGLAAYGVLMYVSMIFEAIFIGYAVGCAPIISYHYGAGNQNELKSLLKKSSLLMGGFSIVMFLCGELLGRPLSILFVGYDETLLEMTSHAFAIFSIAFLFTGFTIFCSAFFTALGDGLTSALISFLRTIVFQTGAILIFSFFWGLNGIWWSVVAAESLATSTAVLFLVGKRKNYLPQLDSNQRHCG